MKWPLFALLLIVLPGYAHADWQRDRIRIVGSSTVYPFVTTAAEHFGEEGRFKTPIVESTGTGGGFKLLCEGSGEGTPDVSNASRRISESEVELCKKNGAGGMEEIQIGYDGIVLATRKGAPRAALTKKQIFLALAKQLPGADGKLAENPYTTWKEIDPSLPETEIAVYGPPPTSGTRDAFVELVMEKACAEFAAFKQAYPDDKARKKACHAVREDGVYVDSGEDDNVIIQKLQGNESALGIFGYSYYENNRARLQAATIDGVLPNYETVESGRYTVSRSMYVYVKREHLGHVPGLLEFVRELTSEGSIGEEGYNTAKGLLPLSASDREAMLARVAGLAASKH